MELVSGLDVLLGQPDGLDENLESLARMMPELERLSPVSYTHLDVYKRQTQDHLDYHKTLENYLAAKKQLFLQSRQAVINVDDPYLSLIHISCATFLALQRAQADTMLAPSRLHFAKAAKAIR